jgi:hypothetical protein
MPEENSKRKTKRYDLPYCEATLKGVTNAETKCKEIDNYLKLGNNDWWLLLPDYQQERIEKSKPQTMEVIKLDFENYYWRNRNKTRKTLDTWDKSYKDIFKKIPDEDSFTPKNIEKWITTTEPNSKPRQDLIRVIKALADYKGIKDTIDWRKDYSCKYKSKPRTLPSDEEIEYIYSNIDRDDVRWSLGMIATYGLRPQELFQLEPKNIEEFLAITEDSNTHILPIPEDTKTGERFVYPLHPEWIEKFDLANVCRLESNAKSLETKVSWLNKLFSKYGLKGGAYNLRHRYAVRAIELHVDESIAAKWMGHSLEEHCKTYQKWMDKSTHNKAFNKLLSKASEDTEIARLKFENQYLKDEVKRLQRKTEQLEAKLKLSELDP